MIQEKIAPASIPAAIGPYSPGLSFGDFVLISGQLPVNGATGEMPATIEEQTRQSLENLKAILADRGLEMRHVVKTTVFLADMNDFAAMNGVYAEYFSEPYPTRSAVQVARLPKDAKVEIEAFAIDTRALEIMCSEEADTCCGCCCHEK